MKKWGGVIGGLAAAIPLVALGMALFFWIGKDAGIVILFVLVVSALLLVMIIKTVRLFLVLLARKEPNRDFKAADRAGRGTGQVLHTDRATVWINFPIDLERDVKQVLAHAMQQWRVLTGLSGETTAPLRIMIFKDYQEMKKYSAPFMAGSSFYSGYFIKTILPRVVIHAQPPLLHEEILVHELIHHLEYSHFKKIPQPWLAEGLAELARFNLSKVPRHKGSSFRWKQAAQARKELLPGSKLLSLSYRQLMNRYLRSKDILKNLALFTFYRQSRLLVQYLIHERQSAFQQFLTQNVKKGMSPALFRECLGIDADQAMEQCLEQITPETDGPLASPPEEIKQLLDQCFIPQADDGELPVPMRCRALMQIPLGGWHWGAGVLIKSLSDKNRQIRDVGKWSLENLSGQLLGDQPGPWLKIFKT